MASFVVDWSSPLVCTSALKLTKKVLVLNGEFPLVNADLNELFKETKPAMKVVLREKSETWSGVIESKWGEYLSLYTFQLQ